MNAPVRALVASILALTLLVPLIVQVPPAAATTPDRAPVYVDSVEVAYLESYPVQVHLRVHGSVPSPCHQPVWAMTDDGTTIDLELWSEADPEVDCATVLRPVEMVIPVGDFETAERVVVIDGRPMAQIVVGHPISEQTQLLGAGWSFGMCMGHCRSDLVVAGQRLTLTGSDRGADVPLYVNRGTLTADGTSGLAASLQDVDPSTLEAVYGCPDCADGGAAYVSLIAAGQQSDHVMEFGRPPAELEPVHEQVEAIMNALRTCSSDALVTVDEDCAPYVTR